MGAPLLYDQIRYVPETFKLLFSDGTTRDIEPKTISRISIENYYSSSFLPLIKIEFATDLQTFFKITDDKEKVSAQLRIDFYPYTQDKERDKKVRILFDQKFAIYIDEDKPELHEELNDILKAETKVGADKSTDSAANKFLNISVFLFDQSILDWAYGYESGVIKSADMQSTISYLLSKLGRKGIMSPMDNKSIYSQIFLPAMTRIDLIKYLNAQYGFYKAGYKFFVDYDMFYFLDNKPGCSAWSSGDTFKKTVINIRESDNVNRFADGSKQVSEENTGYININPSKLYFDTPAIFNNVLRGNGLVSISSKKTSATITNGKTTQRGSAYKAFVNNRYNNPYSETKFISDAESDSKVLSFSTTLSNRVWFAPNKEQIVHFDNPNLEKVYGGRYRLHEMIMVLYTSGDFMENQIIVSLKK